MKDKPYGVFTEGGGEGTVIWFPTLERAQADYEACKRMPSYRQVYLIEDITPDD